MFGFGFWIGNQKERHCLDLNLRLLIAHFQTFPPLLDLMSVLFNYKHYYTIAAFIM